MLKYIFKNNFKILLIFGKYLYMYIVTKYYIFYYYFYMMLNKLY